MSKVPTQAAAQFEGNLVWKALTDHSVQSWYDHGDKALLEALMSLTGSLIVGSAEGGLETSDDGGKSLPTTYAGGLPQRSATCSRAVARTRANGSWSGTAPRSRNVGIRPSSR